MPTFFETLGAEAHDGDSTVLPGGGTSRALGYDAPEISPYVGGANASKAFFQTLLDSSATHGEQVGEE